MKTTTHVPMTHPQAGTAKVPLSYLDRARSKGWTPVEETKPPPAEETAERAVSGRRPTPPPATPSD